MTLPLDADGDLYVFAYGSLIWRPGFPHIATEAALLRGWHRGFCLRSQRYRGTPAQPGLVLGLDRGGACRGMALRVAGAEAAAALAYLDARELPDGAEIVYRRRLLPVRLLASDRTVRAVTYTARRDCSLYCGDVSPAAAARTIAAAQGEMGRNRDYLLQTIAHLAQLGVRDAGLDAIAALLPAEPAGAHSSTASA